MSDKKNNVIETEYVLIPKNTIDSYKISEDHTLTPDEAAKITVNSKLIKKFIEQKAISMQFDIGAGKWKGEEIIGLKVVEALSEIANEVGNIKKTFDSYLKQKREEEQKNQEKQEEA